MSIVSVDATESPISYAVVANVQALAPILRLFAVGGLLATLWFIAYGGPMLFDAIHARPIYRLAAHLVVAPSLLVPTWLLWTQAATATRFGAAPSDALLEGFFRANRRFWRVSAFISLNVLALTVLFSFVVVGGG